jgi:predicted transcriptional regulator
MADQELSEPITHRLPLELLEKLEKVAKGSERTRTWYLVRALRYYFAENGEGTHILNALAGREDIEKNGGHDFDEVIRELEEIVRGKVA